MWYYLFIILSESCLFIGPDGFIRKLKLTLDIITSIQHKWIVTGMLEHFTEYLVCGFCIGHTIHCMYFNLTGIFFLPFRCLRS